MQAVGKKKLFQSLGVGFFHFSTGYGSRKNTNPDSGGEQNFKVQISSSGRQHQNEGHLCRLAWPMPTGKADGTRLNYINKDFINKTGQVVGVLILPKYFDALERTTVLGIICYL